MNLSEQQLRLLVDETLARHLERRERREWNDECRSHSSHGMLRSLERTAAGEPCLIEPAVRCNHCGYCQSLGH